MATKAKTVNYTDEQTAKVVQDYTSGVSVETIAAALGKTARSVVAKLSREGVYKKAEKVSKVTGAATVKKDEHASALAALVGLTDSEADSLTKANKTALAKILAHMESDVRMALHYEELLAAAGEEIDDHVAAREGRDTE